MNLQSFLESPISISLALWIGKIVPPSMGYRLAETIAEYLGSKKQSNLVRAIRFNQSVIHNFSICEEELEQITKEVLLENTKCIYDFYHYINQPEKIPSLIQIEPEISPIVERIKSNLPTIVVVPHTSNFDLMGIGLHLMGIQFQILSVPNPNQSYQKQNNLRKKLGLEITPISIESFRQAKSRLKMGGSVLTGVDRPIKELAQEKYRPKFFGYPAPVPVFHIRLAIELNVPLCVLACVRKSSNIYSLVGSELIYPVQKENLIDSIVSNAEIVLQAAERIILKYSNQWSMFFPIWDEKDLIQQLSDKNKEVVS